MTASAPEERTTADAGHEAGPCDTILVAEDDPVSRLILQSWLQKWTFRVVACEDGQKAWTVLQRQDSPQIVILDWMMPGLDGIELCRRIRGQENGSYKYVLLLTARGSKEDIVAGLEAGADDYLTKPFDWSELRARVRAGVRILQLQSELLKTQASLQFEAAHDRLTGLWNRGAISDLLQRETQRCARIGSPLGIMLADVDHFKHVNDTYGHQAGDAVLREVSRRLLESVRSYDYVGRYGGEEFLLVLGECGSADLAVIAERTRLQVAEKPVETPTGPVSVSVSIGLMTQPKHEGAMLKEAAARQAEKLVQAADVALYTAKANGRNRVERALETSLVV